LRRGLRVFIPELGQEGAEYTLLLEGGAGVESFRGGEEKEKRLATIIMIGPGG